MSKQPPSEIVVLLHGIANASIYMMPVEKLLQKKGYETLNITYPSVERNIESLTRWLGQKISSEKIWDKYSKVHFVAHSMGGLVGGFYLEKRQNTIPKDKMGRVIMIGTPHGGSEVADFLKENPLFKKFFGPAGQQLTTEQRNQQKITPWYELGIIAGKTDNALDVGNLFIHDAHDGCVSVESTKVEGMKDHIVIPSIHYFMAWTPKVQQQVVTFLEKGQFSK